MFDPNRIRIRAIIKKGDKYLLVKINEDINKGQWQFAGGNAESKDYVSEVKREIQEELGVDFANIKFAFKAKGKRGWTHFYTGNISGNIKIQEEEISQYKYFTKAQAQKLSLTRSSIEAFKRLTPCQRIPTALAMG